jgi:hypothetical protein
LIGGLSHTSGLISSSAQIAADISGSFNTGFEFSGKISGSATSTGSLSKVFANIYSGDFSAVTANEDGHISSSEQLSADISGSFNTASPNYLVDALEYSNNVASASFHNLEITNLTGDGSQFSASLQSQLLTSATQISNSISGSFNKGFDLQGGVSASFGLYSGAWTTGASLINTNKRHHHAVGNKDNSIHYGGWGGSRLATTELWNGATGTWTELNDMTNARNTGADFGSGVDDAIGAGGQGSAGNSVVSDQFIPFHASVLAI